MDENLVLDAVTPVEEIEQEKLLPQSQVNKIVQREKEQAAAKARREVEERYQRELEQINAQSQQQNQRNQNVSREVDADAIFQQVQERFNREMQQKQVEQEMTQIANSYMSKMQKGRESYEDFDEVTKEFDPTLFPQLVYLVAGLDNAADVMYELARNPVKLNALDGLAAKSPRYAQAQLLELSRSIADNKQAKAEADTQNVAAPLDRLQPSRVSGSNGKMGVKDLRSMPWLRG